MSWLSRLFFSVSSFFTPLAQNRAVAARASWLLARRLPKYVTHGAGVAVALACGSRPRRDGQYPVAVTATPVTGVILA